MSMLTDEQYDLAAQLVEESKSLKRIKEIYKAEGDASKNHELWEKLEQEKESNIEMLKSALQTCLSQK